MSQVTHSERPVGIAVLSTLYTVFGVISAAALAYAHEKPAAWDQGLALAGWYLLAVLYVVAGIGLWGLRNWARRVAILISATQIGVAVVLLVLLSQLTPLNNGMLIPLIGAGLHYAILLYLRTRTIRAVFVPSV